MKNNSNDNSLTENNIPNYITKFSNDLHLLINNIKSNHDNNIDTMKNQLINTTKDIINDLLNRINILQNENGQIKKKFEKYKSNGEIKKHFLEKQLKNVYKKESEKTKQIKNKNIEISKLSTELSNLKNEYNLENNKLIKDNENMKINYEILDKQNKKIKCEISELKELNIKYELTISELEKENNDLIIENQNEIKNNNIKYKKKLEEMQNEIVALNNELDEREQDFQEYKNKYEKELKLNEKLENKIQEYINNKGTEDDYMTEYEVKKRNIPNRISTEIKRNTTNEIEKIEKKFKYLYRTVENTRNQSKNSHNSAISTKEKNNILDNNNFNKIKETKSKLCRNNTSAGFKHLLNQYKKSNKKENNNNYNTINDLDNENNSTNINSNSSIKLTPENFSFIKLYQLNNKLKWCLFKKNKTRAHLRLYSTGNELLNSDLDLYDYSDFIWMPYKTSKDFPEFREISSFMDSYEIKSEKNSEIEELKISIKNMENVISEKDKENNKLNNALNNLIMENQKIKNYNEKLKEENYKIKYEIKPDKNFIGVSFIADDPESSKFLDDKCCEDILTGLDKNPNRNNSRKNIYSEKLKNSIDMLMSKVMPNENINNLMANILRQLGCSDEDIYKIIGNHRGVISIPFNKNK